MSPGIVSLRSLTWLVAVLAGSYALVVRGAEPRKRHLNVPARTLGGRHYWADVLIDRGWRIQRHALTGHHRLLDDHDVRRAWGTREVCEEKLAEKLPPATGDSPRRYVVLLHGLLNSRQSMESLGELLEQDGAFTVVEVGYPSSRADISAHAETLAQVLSRLRDAKEINLVGHSLGNLVIRRYMAIKATGESPQPMIHRVVMIGPPNQGSPMADLFASNWLADQVIGAVGRQIAEAGETPPEELAIPDCEFGIIAGGKGDNQGWNPLIAGDDDGVVGVADTHLAGARDFLVLPVLHTPLLKDETVQQCTRRFLTKGYFISERERCTIPAARQTPDRR